jgi:hypothetical protein
LAMAGLGPSAAARIPSGRSLSSTRLCTLNHPGDRAVVALPVHVGGDREQQRCQLHHLTVASAGQRRRLLEAGTLARASSSTPSARRGGGSLDEEATLAPPESATVMAVPSGEIQPARTSRKAAYKAAFRVLQDVLGLRFPA